jgi:hypothetical protein
MSLPETSFKPAGTPVEVLARLLDASAACLDGQAGLEVPDDELHREILLPLLPAMLGDKAIRQHWREQAATGFLARLAAHLEGRAPVPRWEAADFEVHVSTSYLAGPDAKALADTLLSEESLRDLTAALMNQVLERVWATLPVAAPIPVAVPEEPEPVVEAVEAVEIAEVPVAVEMEVEVAPAVEIEPEVEMEEVVESPAAESEELVAASSASTLAWLTPVPELPAIQRVLIRLNPIRGTVHTFGGLGQLGWQARNPLKRRR